MLSLSISNLGDWTVFKCTGRLVAGDAGALHHAVLMGPHVAVWVLDLGEVSITDAAGWGALVALQTQAGAAGKELKLLNLRPAVEELLELTHLNSVFKICTTRDMVELLCRAIQRSDSQTEMPTNSPETPAAGGRLSSLPDDAIQIGSDCA